MKIVILDGDCANPGDLGWESFERLGEVTVYPHTPREKLLERAKDAEVLIDNKVEIDRSAIDALPKLRYIGLLSTGYNVVDLEAADRRGIAVCNVPSYSTMSVAQHTFALLLSFANRIAAHDESVRRGDWSKCSNFCYWLETPIELCGRTMGIVGYGEIGRAVAAIAHSLGMEVVAYRRSDGGETQPFVRRAGLDELLRESDVVSLHCDLNAGNARMVNGDFIAAMKDGAVLINTARGGLADEEAIAEALRSGKLAAYLADVAAHEPPSDGSPLFGAPHCTVTPHIAWASREARKRLIAAAADNLRAYLDGNPRNVVNAPFGAKE